MSKKAKKRKTLWLPVTCCKSATFLKIIRGESELSSFDDFVKEWQEEGGNEIIQEMIQERKSLSSQENQKTEEKAEQKAE